ncbi:MAG: methyltransferase domain-containing protein [Tepidisphaeraceae bacterium]
MSVVRETWCAHLGDELSFWDDYLRTRGGEWPDEFAQRVNPDAPLIEMAIVNRIRPGRRRARILDVGAGPLTILGKQLPGVTLDIIAVDPLADSYNELLERHGIIPPAKTRWCEGEKLAAKFKPDSFDFAYARNALDHAHDPLIVIEQMVTLVKPGGWVILRHRPNEAETAAYTGLHQWNFELVDGRFRVRSREAEHDVSAALDRVAQVDCTRDGQWLLCAFRKRTTLERLWRRIVR